MHERYYVSAEKYSPAPRGIGGFPAYQPSKFAKYYKDYLAKCPPPPEKNVGFDPKKPHMTSIVKCKLKKVDFYQVPTYVLTFF